MSCDEDAHEEGVDVDSFVATDASVGEEARAYEGDSLREESEDEDESVDVDMDEGMSVHTVTFRPGRNGFQMNSTGKVWRVEQGSQADYGGLKVCMVCHQINGAGWSENLYDMCWSGERLYDMKFLHRRVEAGTVLLVEPWGAKFFASEISFHIVGCIRGAKYVHAAGPPKERFYRGQMYSVVEIKNPAGFVEMQNLEIVDRVRPHMCCYCGEVFSDYSQCHEHILFVRPCSRRYKALYKLDSFTWTQAGIQQCIHEDVFDLLGRPFAGGPVCQLQLSKAIEGGFSKESLLSRRFMEHRFTSKFMCSEGAHAMLPGLASYGQAILHGLLSICSEDVFKHILQENPSLARERDCEGDLPLHFALRHLEISSGQLKSLLAAYPDSVKEADRHLNLPLKIATDLYHAHQNDTACLIEAYPCALLSLGGGIEFVIQAAYGNPIIPPGEQVIDFPDEAVLTALHSAPSEAVLIILKELAAIHDNLCQSKVSRDLLLETALEASQPLEVVRAILKMNPESLSSKQVDTGNTPLHIAALSKSEVKVVQELLKEEYLNCNLSSPYQAVQVFNEDGDTPLHIALSYGQNDVARLLVKHMADPLALNSSGETPLGVFARTNLDRPEGQQLLGMMFETTVTQLGQGRSFKERISWFENCIQQLQDAKRSLQPDQGPIVATVLRGQVLEGLCAAIQRHRGIELLGGLEISIHGENAEGDGVVREVLSLLALELCDANVGLFKIDAVAGMLHPSSQSSVQLDHLEYFNLIGKLIGVALGNAGNLPVPLSSPLLKILLDVELSLCDLKDVDADVYRSLLELQILSEEKLSELDLDFTYNDVFFGEAKIVKLLPVGMHTAKVTTKTSLDIYLGLVANHLMKGSTSQQIEALKRGLHMMVPEVLLRAAGKVFSVPEFRQLIAGIAEIDGIVVDDWQHNTEYQGGYHNDHPTVQAFWDVLRGRFSPLERSALLRFVHGSSRAPVQGFSSLLGYDGNRRRFTLVREEVLAIGRQEIRSAYPRAQTCFNTLYLPDYASIDELERRLRAVTSNNAGEFDEGAVAG